MTDTVLEVKNLTKQFDKFTAVDNISFYLRPGEILGLLGPNGAGKTTTIQMLLGVMDATNGKISYLGKDFSQHRVEILKNINFSSGYISLPWLFTVGEILNIFARLYGVSERQKRIKKLLTVFEIEDLVKKQFYKLSAGQRSRVFLVKAFLNYPKIILLDEPTASLDPDIAKSVRNFLKKERDEFQVSILFTSHNMPEVEEVCDRVMFINHGKIVSEGTPSEIAQRIKDCRLQLVMIKDKEKAISYLRKNNYSVIQDKSYITITVEEHEISHLLSALAKQKIDYEGISIEKPSLEDFFLNMTEKKYV